MEKKMKTERIPQTDSIEELASFWDAHDLTDFEDQLEEVTEPIFERETETAIVFKLRPEAVKSLKWIAKLKGVGYKDLVRQWVLEKIQSS